MAESGKYDITVAVKTAYLADQSDPSRDRYVFAYTSGTHLPTAVGTMRGTYQMVAEDGHAFDAAIPLFTLSVPRVLH